MTISNKNQVFYIYYLLKSLALSGPICQVYRTKNLLKMTVCFQEVLIIKKKNQK